MTGGATWRRGRVVRPAWSWAARAGRAVTRDGPYQVRLRPSTRATWWPGNISGPSAALNGYGSSGRTMSEGPAGRDVSQVDVRVAAGVIGVDVVQAEPGGQVAGEGARTHHHPGVAPDRDGRAGPRPGRGFGPDLLGFGQPGRLRPAQRGAEHPAQGRQCLLKVPDHGHPDRHPGRAEAFHVDAAILLLVGQHDVGLQRFDGGQVRVLGPPDPGHVQVGGVGAPDGGADQGLGPGHRHRLGQGRHQGDDPAGRTGQPDQVAEIVGRRLRSGHRPPILRRYAGTGRPPRRTLR